ncbi:IS1/IS1595 family N-terminal zinc-binding domain-containing protein [Candidatus Trichorickettsia mobilis]
MFCCKHCGGYKAVKNGFVKNKQRYLCQECGKRLGLVTKERNTHESKR